MYVGRAGSNPAVLISIIKRWNMEVVKSKQYKQVDFIQSVYAKKSVAFRKGYELDKKLEAPTNK